MNPFKAMVVNQQGDTVVFPLQEVALDHLSPGEVVVKVAYSSVNFKDSLAVKAGGGVIRSYPMIPGIDLSGTVVSSADPAFQPGQQVLATGFQLGMSHTGGYAEYARMPGSWLIPLPEELTLRDAMVIGTAGFTAALSISALEKMGMKPENNPDILVTGASGGVGSIATQILAKSGYKNICALTRDLAEEPLLRELGATSVLELKELLPEKPRPLGKARFHYVVDTVGGDVTAAAIPQIQYGGSMSMCGNAAGIQLNTNVLPFILRGINLLGIDSVEFPYEERPQIWKRLATDWNITKTAIVQETTLEGLPQIFEALQGFTHVGRTIVKINGS